MSEHDESEERRIEKDVAAHRRRRRLGHAGAAAAGISAGGIASGAADELDLFDIVTGDDPAAEESPDSSGEDDSSPSLDVFEDVMRERATASLDTAREVLEEIQAAGAGVSPESDATQPPATPPDVGAPPSATPAIEPDASPETPADSVRPPSLGRPGAPDPGAAAGDDAAPVPPAASSIASAESESESPPATFSDPAPAPPPAAAGPTPGPSTSNQPAASEATESASGAGPPPPTVVAELEPAAPESASPAPPPAASPAIPGEETEAPSGPPSTPAESSEPAVLETGPPAGAGTSEPESGAPQASASATDEAEGDEAPAPESSSPVASSEPRSDEPESSSPASSPGPEPPSSGPTPPDDPDVPSSPGSSISPPPAGVAPPADVSDSGEDIVVDVQPGSPPPPADSELPDPPSSLSPDDDGSDSEPPSSDPAGDEPPSRGPSYPDESSSPEPEYSYEEVLADWEGQELIFPDAIGYIGIGQNASFDPNSLIGYYGEPEVSEGDGYYELTWTSNLASEEIEITQRLYNNGSGRVSVEFDDWVRTTWVDGEAEVEVYYQGEWRPTIYVEEWGLHYYTVPDPYTGDPMLAYIEPVTGKFEPGIMDEAAGNIAPAIYDAESGHWVEAVWDLSVNAYVPVGQAVEPAYWDGDHWVASDDNYEGLDHSIDVPIQDYANTADFYEALGEPDQIHYGEDYMQRVWDDAPFATTDYTFYGRYAEEQTDDVNYPSVTQTIWEDGRIEWVIDDYLRIDSYPDQEPSVYVWDGDSWEPGYYDDGEWAVASGGIDFDESPLETPIPEADTDGHPHVLNIVESVNLHDLFNDSEESGTGSSYVATVEYPDGSIHEYSSAGTHYLLLDNGERVLVEDGVELLSASNGNTIELQYPDGTIIQLDRDGNMTIDAAELSGGQVSYDYYPDYVYVEFEETAWLFDAETGQPYSVSDPGDPLGSMELYEGNLPLSLHAVSPYGNAATFATTNGTIFEYDDEGCLHILDLAEGDADDLGISTDYASLLETPEENSYGDMAGQYFGPDDDYPFPGDVAEVVYHQAAEEGQPQATFYSNGAVVWTGQAADEPDGAGDPSIDVLFSINNAIPASISWYYDADGNPADFSGLTPPVTQTGLDAYLAEHGYYNSYTVHVDGSGNVISEDIPWDYAGTIEGEIEGLEGWQDPAVEYGFDEADFSFNEYGQAVHIWNLPDGTVVTRTTSPDGDWSVQYGTPPDAYQLANDQIYLWSEATGGWTYGLWDTYNDRPMHAVYDESSGEYVPAILDEATGDYVAAHWDEESGNWEPYEMQDPVGNLTEEAEPPSYPGYDPASYEDYAPQILESPHDGMVRLQFHDGAVHEFDYDGNHYLVHDAGMASEYAQVVEGGMGMYGYSGSVVELRMPAGDGGYASTYLDLAAGHPVSTSAYETVEFDPVNGIVRYVENGTTHIYDLDGDQTWHSYQFGDADMSEPMPSSAALLEIDAGPPPRAIFEHEDGSVRVIESDGSWSFLSYPESYAESVGFANTDYQLGETFYWDESTDGWESSPPISADEPDDGDGAGELSGQALPPDNLGPDGAGYPNPYMQVWGTGDVQEIDPQDAAAFLQVDLPQSASFYPNGAVGLTYPDGSYRVLWLEDIDGAPVIDWEQVATGNAYIDYQVYVEDNVITAEIPAGSAVSTAVGESDAITPAGSDDEAPDEDPATEGESLVLQETEAVPSPNATDEETSEPTGYLGPDGASYTHPFTLYEFSPVVDEAQAAEMLGWPEGTEAYLYPGGELVMMYGDGSMRIAWLQDAQTGAPVTSLDEAGNGQTVIDYAAQVDANGQLDAVLIQPGADVLIEPTLTFDEPEETGDQPGDEELETAWEGEMEPLDFSEEPDEDHQAEPTGEGDMVGDEIPAGDEIVLQPNAEADPAAGLDPLPGTEDDGLPPGMEDAEDDVESIDDDDGGLP